MRDTTTPAAPSLQPNPALGIALKLVSVLVFIVMSALVKAVADHVPPGEAVFFRSAFAIPVILGLALQHLASCRCPR